MPTVNLADADLRDLVAELYAAHPAPGGPVTVDGDTVRSTDDLVLRMVKRAGTGRVFVLPLATRTADRWMVLGDDEADLDRAVQQIERALVPSFAAFPTDGMPTRPTGEGAARMAATRQHFDPSRDGMHAAGSRRYPGGYYRFVSPRDGKAREEVHRRLLRWADLDEGRPPPRADLAPTYRSLSDRFHAASAAGQWEEARRAIDDLEANNLCGADNIRFLEVVLLARQGRWHDLWEAPDRDRILRLRYPRSVRAAMLEAFHAVELAPLEVDGAEASLAVYRQRRQALGTLLAGRFGLVQPPVVAVFGHEAAAEGDRTKLEALIAEAEGAGAAPPILRLLLALTDSIGVEPPMPGDADVRVRTAIRLGELEEALVAADDIADATRRLLARIEIAAQAADRPLAVDVLLAVAALTERERAALGAASPAVDAQIGLLAATVDVADEVSDELERGTGPIPVEAARDAWSDVVDWVGWFAASADLPTPPEAYKAVRRVEGSFERSFDDMWAVDLADRILEVVAGDAANSPVVVDAIDRLAGEALADSGFARPGYGAGQLYGSLFDGLVSRTGGGADASQRLIALADALLSRSPARLDEMATPLLTWFSQPYPALEQRALETIELLVDYGIAAHRVATPVREWVTEMLARPSAWDRDRTAVWQLLVAWSGAGQHLERALDERLAQAADTQDPVAALPADVRVVIYTLHEPSAERAKHLLVARRPGLRVDVCGDHVMTPRARQLAEAADIPVIVTGCAKHALTEGVRPFLKQDPVYPSGVGSTGIVRAVADRAAGFVGG